MSDKYIEIAPEYREGTIDGMPVSFRAYIAKDKTQKLAWKIGDRKGNEAVFDPQEPRIALPNGRFLMQGGQKVKFVHPPRWLADALLDDFEEFDTEIEPEEVY
jgi:hypothetical protein